MTKTDAKDYAKRKLGFGVVNVELTDAQVDDAYSQAARWFSSRKGEKKSSSLSVVNGEAEYSISGANTILNVLFPEDKSYMSGNFNYQVYGTDYIPYISDTSYSTLVLAQQAVSDRMNITGADKDWQYDNVGKKLYISPEPIENYTVKYFYLADIDDTSESGISSLSSFDLDIFLRYLVADMKLTLGRIRAKFASGFESAAGNVSLDGSELISEAKEEIMDLENEIRDTQEPMGILFG